MRMFARSGIVNIITLVTLASAFYTANADKGDLEVFMNRMESDAKDLAAKLEELFANRCDADYMADCAMGSYDACLSEFPSATCSPTDLVIPECVNSSCGAQLDYTVSTVRLPLAVLTQGTPNRNPGPLDAKEAVCYSLQAEDTIKEMYEDYREWANAYPPSIHFGSDSGVFRIFPARQTKDCNAFDPRLRPWYLAASSVPKDIVIIIDTDRPETYSSRMKEIKDAAIWVINNTLNVNDTLTVGDFVAVVGLNDTARTPDNSEHLQIVTAEAKEGLIDRIESSTYADNNNFYDLFDMALRIMREPEDKRLTTGCRRAILYLTDKITSSQDGSRNVSDVQDLLSNHTDLNNPAIFTFSFGSKVEEGNAKSIACATKGIWTAILDGEDLAAAMGGYHKYFAYGLDHATDETDPRFVSWVKPYNFSTGGVKGTAVSAPVYDTGASPPVFIGVVGLDMTLTAMREILDTDEVLSALEEQIRKRRFRVCPTLTLNQCEIQSLRNISNSGNDKAMCESECTNFTNITSEACSSNDYPKEYWKNTNYKKKETFEDRICCTAEQCPKSPDDDDDGGPPTVALVVGSAVGGLVVLAIGIVLYRKYYRPKTLSSSERHIEVKNQRNKKTREGR